MIAKLTINPDEFSQDIHEALPLIRQIGVNHVELRSLSGKNLLDFSLKEVKNLSQTLQKNDLRVAAIASPLFKWYVNADSPEVEFDHFYFEPRISVEQKKAYILKALQIAEILNCPVVRVFSYLTDYSFSVNDFVNDELVHFAIAQAERCGVKLALENEPICTVQRKNDIANLMQILPQTLRLFYDISNFFYVGDTLTKNDVKSLKDRIFYIQCKNFRKNPDFYYVPLSNGVLDYLEIMKWLDEIYAENDEVFINIETHIKENKNAVIRDSFSYLQRVLSNLK